MRKIILAASAALLFVGQSFAADIAVKARPNPYLTYPVGCGLYYGASFSGAAGGSGTSAISGAQMLAGDVGVLGGYTCPIGTQSFWFVESIASVSRVNGGDTAAKFSLAGAASFEQRFAVGAPWSVIQQLTSAIPALGGIAVPSIPSLPPGLSSGPINPYIFVGVNERDVSAQIGLQIGRAWLVSGEIGFGGMTRLSNGMMLDTWVKYQPASTKLKVGLTGQNFQTGDFVGVGMSLKL